MTDKLPAILVLLFSVLSYIAAIVVYFKSVNHRTDKFPNSSHWNPKLWKPVWKTREWYTSTGYKLQIVFIVLICIGAVGFITGLYLGGGFH